MGRRVMTATWCDTAWTARPDMAVPYWHHCALPHPHDTVHVCECGATFTPAPPA